MIQDWEQKMDSSSSMIVLANNNMHGSQGMTFKFCASSWVDLWQQYVFISKCALQSVNSQTYVFIFSAQVSDSQSHF